MDRRKKKSFSPWLIPFHLFLITQLPVVVVIAAIIIFGVVW